MQRTTPAAPRRGLIRNFEDIIGELRKVIWPSWGELRTMTLVVIMTVVVIAFFIMIVDQILVHSLVKVEFPNG